MNHLYSERLLSFIIGFDYAVGLCLVAYLDFLICLQFNLLYHIFLRTYTAIVPLNIITPFPLYVERFKSKPLWRSSDDLSVVLFGLLLSHVTVDFS